CGFWPYRARVGVSGELADNVHVVLDIQNFGVWGNQSPFQSQTLPFIQNFDGDFGSPGSRSAETSLYQGYVSLNKIGGSAFDLTIGRQEYNLGNGLVIGNEDFYAGNVFDGVKGVW